jgi:hypothetical protein
MVSITARILNSRQAGCSRSENCFHRWHINLKRDALRCLIPNWAKDPKIANKTINARSRRWIRHRNIGKAFMKRRCLIPAGADWLPSGQEGTLEYPTDDSSHVSVELFRYRGAAKDGGTLEYVFEAGEQNSPNAVTKEKATEIAADFMTTFYHVQVGALENSGIADAARTVLACLLFGRG